MTTIHDAFVNAVLADASYVKQLTDGMIGLELEQALSRSMTEPLAEYVGANFTVVTQSDSDELFGSGFDATVWQRNDRKIFVSMRGTDSLAELFLTDVDLATTGAARAQFAEMVNWWLRLTTPLTELVQQIEMIAPIVDANGQWQYFRFKASVFGTGQLVGATGIELNGHSLGGHLATAFARIFGGSTSISNISTFNSAGFTGSSEEVFQNLRNMLGTGTAVFSDAALQTNYFAKGGLNVATNSFYFDQIGQRVELFNEVGTGIANHHMYKLTDTLALMDLMSTIDPNLSTADATKILEAGSPYATASLESILDALRRFYGVPQNLVATKVGDADLSALSRVDFHQNLSVLRLVVGSQPAATISSIAGMSASELITRAQAANGLAYRYALKQLHPFAILGPDSLYNGTGAIRPHNANGELDLYVSQTATPAGMTTEYLTDRAQMLTFLIAGNTNDTDAFASNQVSDQVLYQDLVKRPVLGSTEGKPTEVLVFLPGGTPNFRGPNTRVVGFGSDESDALYGRDNVDRLYGGIAADFLTGGKANDYLEGGAGMDVYEYNASTILGFKSKDGNDTILDTDGRGVIRYTYQDGLGATPKSTVVGGVAIKRTPTQWRSPDEKFIYDQQGSDLLVTVNGDAGGSIMIWDFNFAKAQSDGYLGIRLTEAASSPSLAQPQTSRDINGDLEAAQNTGTFASMFAPGFPQDHRPDFGSVPVGGYVILGVESDPDDDHPISYEVRYTTVDDLGNVVRTGVAAPAYADSLRDGAGNEKITAGGGNDVINAFAGGDDWIEAGEGNDRVEDRGGSNFIDTGAGDDWVAASNGGTNYIVTGAGNDTVRVFDGRSWIATGEGRDVVAPGTGDDLVEAGGDGVWNGDTGGDVVDGGEGNDALYGDVRTSFEEAFAQGNLNNPSGQKGEFFYGGTGDDWLIGVRGNDVLNGGAGRDLIVGGAGDDTVDGDIPESAATLGWTLTRSEVFQDGLVIDFRTNTTGMVERPGQTIDVDAGEADAVYGGSGDDWVYARGGDDYVDGGEGNDSVSGGAGSDILIGGAGNDMLGGDKSNLTTSTDGEDYLDGGTGNDTLWGNGGSDVLIGADGEDRLVGGDGNDLLYGGTGNDILEGGAGKDTYVYNRGDGVDVVVDPDVASASQYRSALALGPGITKDDVKFRLGSLMVDLGQGDAIHFDGFSPDDPFASPVLESIQFADGTALTYADILAHGFDLDGTDENDLINGTAVTDRIDAKAGDDVVIAKAGDDSILGGTGDDVIDAGAGDDVIDAGEGSDIIEAGEGNDTVTTGAGADIVFGGLGDDVVFAGDGDTLIDSEGTNSVDLTGYTGLSTSNLEVTQYQSEDGETYLNLHVEDGLNPGVTPSTGGLSIQRGELGDFGTFTVNDGQGGTLTLTLGQLLSEYGAHGFVYRGRDHGETFTGTGYADTLFGGAGEDAIEGHGGDDRIDGGAGNDTLTGGAGNDTYLLAFNTGRDTVIEDGVAAPDATHTVQLDAGITSAMVYGRRMGEDLELRLRATDDALIIKDFYLQPQSWQDGWRVEDAANGSYTVESFLPVVPPAAATWIDEEKAAYRLRREQIFAANRGQEGYSALGGNSFQRVENSFSYSGRSSTSTTTTRQLVINELNNDLSSQELANTFLSTSLGTTGTTYNMRLPTAAGARGTRTDVNTAWPGSSGTGADGGEFFPVSSAFPGLHAASVRINPGDVVRPVYIPRIGRGTKIQNAGSADYANAGGFEDPSQWTLTGFMIYRAGTGGSAQPAEVSATSSNFTYDQKLTIQDLVAGGANNTVAAGASVVEAGAGNDTVTLGAGYFFAGPDWESAFSFDAADPQSMSSAQSRYFQRYAGLSSYPILYPPRSNLLGGFAHGGAGADTLTGSVGQDVLAGGDGADVLQGQGGSDRYLVSAADSGIDTIADSGIDAIAYLDHYYWSRGILNWDERAGHSNEWRLSEDGSGRFYFKTEAEADAAAAQQNLFNKTFIEALPEAAPVLTRDDGLFDQLIAGGALSNDVLEFGPGLTLSDLDITVSVDAFTAQDYPERPWINGGSVSIRWGANSGVDFTAAPLNSGYEGLDLLTGGARFSADETESVRGWRGYTMGEGIESLRFADGTTLDIDELLASATVVPVSGNYIFRANSGYQLIDRRYEAIELQDGIAADTIRVERDGDDLIITAAGFYPQPSSQGRIRGWYSDPANMPQTRLIFQFNPEIDAATLTAEGLVARGSQSADLLTGVERFGNTLFGRGGDDTLIGQSEADMLSGGPGDDVVRGAGGDDSLVGDVGNDWLDGGEGKDTYVFNAGDGVDTITESMAGAGDPDASVIVFGEGISSADVQLDLGSLVVSYGAGDSIRFTGFNTDDPESTPVFDRLEFQDGSSILYGDLLANGFYLQGTASADVISGSGMHDVIDGQEGNDTLFGLGGQDDMYGGEGDDTLAGGQGDGDSVEGGDGADTYVYAAGDGYDYLSDWGETPGEIDRLQLVGIAPTDVRVGRDNLSYLLLFGGGDRLLVEGVPSDLAPASIERIEFDDGTVWTAADLFARVELLPGTELNDALWGTAGDDVIEALGGDDALLGNGGNDLLIGGEGSDFYYFTAGGGADVVDNYDSDGSWDGIHFTHASLTDATLVKSGDDLVIRIDGGSDRVTLTDWYIDADRKVDQVSFEADGGYWDAATLEQLAPGGGNSAPNVANPITDQAANEDATFSFTVPADAFSDPDSGDTLRYTTGDLPAWLSFDVDMRTFSGTPAQGDVGSVDITVTATDGVGLSTADTFTLTVANVNDAPVVAAPHAAVLRNEALAAAALFSVTDADGDAMTRYEFWDDVAGGGYFSLDGVAQAGNPIPVSAAQLASLHYVGGANPGTEQVWVRANDGTQWSAWKAWNMTSALHIPNTAPEVDAAASQTVFLGQEISASTLFSVNDADGDSITKYEFWDSTAGNGHFTVHGIEQGVNVAIAVAAADLDDAYFVGSTAVGHDVVWVRASDGQTWGDWKSWAMESWPHATNAMPVVSATDASLLSSEAVAAASLFSVTDADGDAMVQYELWDDVNGGGYWGLNGVQQGAATSIAVSAAELASAEYVAGSSGGTERVWARANDGLEWGAWKSWNMTSALHIPNAAPVVSASDATVLLGESLNATSLFSVTDADGDAITQYEFWDSTAANGGFRVAGVDQGVNVAIAVTAAQLPTTEFATSTSTGSDLVWVRASDGQNWSDWKSWNLNSWPHLSNAAPVATASHGGLLREEEVAASSLFSVTDADGDTIQKYELWDDVNGGGYWRVNGAQQVAGQSIAVAAGQLAGAQYVGGANAGTEQVWVRANDGLAWGAWKNWLMSTEGGMLRGGPGPDTLTGDAGPTVLEGGAGDDTITDTEGSNVFSGGDGDDQMTGGEGNDLFAGGGGNDVLDTGGGANVIAFNSGDGTDAVFSDMAAANTLSLGGGIGYGDLSLSKDGNDLIVNTGGDDHLVLKDWYAGKDNVLGLQLVHDATDEFDAGSSDPLHNRKVQSFDFRGLVSQFDAALAQSPGLTSWAMTNALLQFHLSGSDDAAMGGDLAYWYGKNGGLGGISLSAAQQVIGASGFGSDAQSLRPFGGLQEGFVKLT